MAFEPNNSNSSVISLAGTLISRRARKAEDEYDSSSDSMGMASTIANFENHRDCDLESQSSCVSSPMDEAMLAKNTYIGQLETQVTVERIHDSLTSVNHVTVASLQSKLAASQCTLACLRMSERNARKNLKKMVEENSERIEAVKDSMRIKMDQESRQMMHQIYVKEKENQNLRRHLNDMRKNLDNINSKFSLCNSIPRSIDKLCLVIHKEWPPDLPKMDLPSDLNFRGVGDKFDRTVTGKKMYYIEQQFKQLVSVLRYRNKRISDLEESNKTTKVALKRVTDKNDCLELKVAELEKQVGNRFDNPFFEDTLRAKCKAMIDKLVAEDVDFVTTEKKISCQGDSSNPDAGEDARQRAILGHYLRVQTKRLADKSLPVLADKSLSASIDVDHYLRNLLDLSTVSFLGTTFYYKDSSAAQESKSALIQQCSTYLSSYNVVKKELAQLATLTLNLEEEVAEHTLLHDAVDNLYTQLFNVQDRQMTSIAKVDEMQAWIEALGKATEPIYDELLADHHKAKDHVTKLEECAQQLSRKEDKYVLAWTVVGHMTSLLCNKVSIKQQGWPDMNQVRETLLQLCWPAHLTVPQGLLEIARQLMYIENVADELLAKLVPEIQHQQEELSSIKQVSLAFSCEHDDDSPPTDLAFRRFCLDFLLQKAKLFIILETDVLKDGALRWLGLQRPYLPAIQYVPAVKAEESTIKKVSLAFSCEHADDSNNLTFRRFCLDFWLQKAKFLIILETDLLKDGALRWLGLQHPYLLAIQYMPADKAELSSIKQVSLAFSCEHDDDSPPTDLAFRRFCLDFLLQKAKLFIILEADVLKDGALRWLGLQRPYLPAIQYVPADKADCRAVAQMLRTFLFWRRFHQSCSGPTSPYGRRCFNARLGF